MRVLHAIHDFLPRHRAGSEIYAHALARAQLDRHDVTVLCAEYDPARPHGEVRWRMHDEVPVIEVVNNWPASTFAETYRPPLVAARLAHALDLIRPDVVHVHNLLNLSFDLPALAKARGARVVATLHDYTLVCPSGGQRLHQRDAHVCHDIDPLRCANCFSESAYGARVALARAAALPGAAAIGRLAALARRAAPVLTGRAGRALGRAVPVRVTPYDIAARLDAARAVFDRIDLFVAPSPSIADAYRALGVPQDKLVVSDYGFANLSQPGRASSSERLRLGYVGTLVWHKGVHVLIDAMRDLPRTSVELAIFGDTGTFPDYVADLRQRADDLPVTFLGAVDGRRIADAYAAIDALVVPSLWLENSPLVIHEAFRAGVPVVGARIGGIPDLVIDGVNGLLFDAGSASSLARTLRRLLDEPGLAAALASRAPAVKTLAADIAEWDARYVVAAARAAVPA